MTTTHLPETTFHTQTVGEVEVFYRAAGSEQNPVLLLLHGYPSSSHQFRHLIPDLATKYEIQAIPTLLVFESGKLKNRHTGLAQPGLLDKLLQ